MKLTIGMIVKNEETYLERCLTGLKPILENVDSELIITDTGSTDKTVEIAEKFTDKVLYFEWINDFAAARNTTLERAQGEWYMFVDADEIFESCDNIIKFFNSGEYKKYNSASFTIRNILQEDEKHYADFNGPRLTKILPETCFIGNIHEHLSTYNAPFKKLNDIAKHYGYLYNEENPLDDKFKRNSELLLKKYEEDKSDYILFSQLYTCFISHDTVRAEEFLQEGIELCKRDNSIVLTVLYSDKASYLYSQFMFNEAIEICDTYFSMQKTIRPHELTTDGEMLGIKASSLYNLNRFEEAIEEYIKFFDVFKRIQNGKLNTYDMFLQSYTISTDRNFIPLLNEFIRCCILTKKFNVAASYIESLPIEKLTVRKEHADALASQSLEVIKNIGYDHTTKIYKKFGSETKPVFKDMLRNKLYYESEYIDNIIAALESVDKEDDALKDRIEIYKNYFYGKPVSAEQLYSFAEKHNVTENVDIIYIAMDKGIDVSPILSSENCNMMICVYYCYMNLYGFPEIVDNYSPSAIKDTENIPRFIKFLEYCMQTVPIYRCPKPGILSKKSVDKSFNLYAELGKRYSEESGKTEEELTPEMRAALEASVIVEARKKHNYKECFAQMKKVISAYEGITAVIKEYQDIVMIEYKTATNFDPSDEMKRLAKTVKRNIRQFIILDRFEDAEKVLNEYETINPDDPDIISLRSQLASAKGSGIENINIHFK